MPDPDHFHANLQRGSLLLNQNRPREAVPFLQAAIAANPEAPQGYAELARCWNEIPSERSKTIGAIDRAISLSPNNSFYLGRKAWYLVCIRRYHAAHKAANEGLGLNPTCPQSLNSLANVHTKLNQWKSTEAICRRILALHPNDAPALNLLAQALRHQHRWRETREVVAHLLANMPNNAFGHANAGFAALAAGDHLRANTHFRESLRMNPHFDLARRGLLSSLRARIWILRFNHRLMGIVRRPATPRNVLILFLLIFGSIVGFVGLIALAARISNAAAGFTAVVLVGGVVGYFYLVVIVAILGNFLLMFDPLGRHALTRQEKEIAVVPAVLFSIGIIALLLDGDWRPALCLVAGLTLLAVTIQFPLVRDRWLRRRLERSAE